LVDARTTQILKFRPAILLEAFFGAFESSQTAIILACKNTFSSPIGYIYAPKLYEFIP
jgi:hypothetical protein